MERDDDYQVNSESRHKIAFVSFLGFILIKFLYKWQRIEDIFFT